MKVRCGRIWRECLVVESAEHDATPLPVATLEIALCFVGSMGLHARSDRRGGLTQRCGLHWWR